MELIRSNIDESTVTSYDSLHQISRLFEAIAALKKSIDIITDDIHTLRRVAYYLHSKMAGRKGPQATPETDLYPNVES